MFRSRESRTKRFPGTGTVLPAPTGTAPAITSGGAFSVNENAAYEQTATASGTTPLTWSKSGADAALITLNTSTGVWSLPAQDYETKPSVSFSLTVTNAFGTDTDPVVVTINDVAEGGEPATVFGAPGVTLTSASTAYPPTVAAEFYPADHMVGDTLRIFVTSATVLSSGSLIPSGTTLIDQTIVLVADPATNNAAINAKLAGIAAGVGYPFLRTERGADIGAWSIPVQYGTAAVPTITSSLTVTNTESDVLAYTLTLTDNVRAVYLVGQDGDRVEFVNAAPGASFAMQWVGNGTKTYPADDFNGDNIYDIDFEVLGLNGVTATYTTFTLELLDLDLTADPFNFADMTTATVGGYGQSPTTITVGGLAAGRTVPITLGAGTEVSINGGAFTTTPVEVGNLDNIDARVSTPIAGIYSASVTYGGQTDSFQATTTGYVAPAAWTTAAGYNKSADLGVTSTTITGVYGADTGVRVNKAPTADTFYYDVTITSGATTGKILIGIDAGDIDFTTPPVGNAGSADTAFLQINSSGTDTAIYGDGYAIFQTNPANKPATWADGDIIRVEGTQSTGAVKFYFKRGGAAFVQLGTTATVTTMAAWRASHSGSHGAVLTTDWAGY